MTRLELRRIVKENGGYLTRSSLADALNISLTMAYAKLRQLVADGRLKVTGVKRSTRYLLT